MRKWFQPMPIRDKKGDGDMSIEKAIIEQDVCAVERYLDECNFVIQITKP